MAEQSSPVVAVVILPGDTVDNPCLGLPGASHGKRIPNLDDAGESTAGMER